VQHLFPRTGVAEDASPYYPIEDDCILYLNPKTDQNLLDRSIHANHGTNHGGTLTADGIDLDPGDYVDCGSDASLKPTEAITIAFWTKMSSVQAAWGSAYALTNGEGWSKGYGLRMFGNGGLILQPWVNGFQTCAQAKCIGDLWKNAWIHVCMTYDKTKITVYINAIRQSEKAHSTSIDYTGVGNLTLGIAGSTSYNTDGILDEIMIFNTSKTQTEVADIFLKTSSRHDYPQTEYTYDEPDPDCFLYLPLYSRLAIDRSGNNNHGIQIYDLSDIGDSWGNFPLQFTDGLGIESNADRRSGCAIRQAASMEPTDALTIYAWLRTHATLGTPSMTSLLNYGTVQYDGSGYGMSVHGTYPNQAIRVWINDFEHNGFDALTPIVPGSWFFAAFTYDKAKIRIYINGALDPNSMDLTEAITYVPSTDRSQVGLLNDLRGSIGEIRAFGIAKTQSQIQTHFNAKKARWSIS
jgi:hypothetical protein